MIVKIDGEIVASLPGKDHTPYELLFNDEVHAALGHTGRIVTGHELHPSGHSINFITRPPIDHLPHAKRAKCDI